MLHRRAMVDMDKIAVLPECRLVRGCYQNGATFVRRASRRAACFSASERSKGNIPANVVAGNVTTVLTYGEAHRKPAIKGHRSLGLAESSVGPPYTQTQGRGTALWMGAAFVVGLVIVVTVYAVGAPLHRLGMALRATARWSFLLFCLATYGGALTVLFSSRFQGLARHGRDLGLAFAAAQSVHFILVAWLLYSAPDSIPLAYLIVFSVGVFWVYVLAAFSLSNTLGGWLGPGRWKIVRKIGVEYLAFAFAFEFANRILDGNRANGLHYLPLFAAAVGGPLLRIAAALKSRSNAAHTPGLIQH